MGEGGKGVYSLLLLHGSSGLRVSTLTCWVSHLDGPGGLLPCRPLTASWYASEDLEGSECLFYYHLITKTNTISSFLLPCLKTVIFGSFILC